MAWFVRPLGHVARPLLTLLFLVACSNAAKAQSHFSCFEGQGNIYNSTVIVPESASLSINGADLPVGSEIGVFSSDPSLADTCVGKMTWQGASTALTVWGEDDLTTGRDGLVAGNELRYRLWNSETLVEHAVDPAGVAYVSGDGIYADDALFVVSALTVAVVEAPMVANNDASATTEDSSVQIDVLANDTGGSSGIDPASIAILSPPENGEIVTINSTTGIISYLPGPNFSGEDSFTYVVFNNSGTDSKTATVNIDVTEVNDLPVANNDSATGVEDQQTIISILANDTDVDDPSLDIASVSILTLPQFGEILNIDPASGDVTYRPATNYHGTDSFTYRVSDPRGGQSATAIATIDISSVNDAPVAVSDETVTDEDTQIKVSVLSNDADVDGDEVDPSSVQIRQFPSNGYIKSIHRATGQITYMPFADYYGTDVFTYKVRDVYGQASNEVAVYITINGVNDDPKIRKKPVESTPKGRKYDNRAVFADPDNDALTLTAVALPTWMTATDNGDGSLDLEGTPPLTETGAYEIGLVADDGRSGTTTYNFVLTVDENAAPFAEEDYVSLLEDTSLAIDILANDSDPEGDLLDTSSITIVTPPTNGTVSFIDPTNGQVTYEPNPEYFGSDSFEYTVLDEIGNRSNIVLVTLDITPVTDAPVVADESVEAQEDVEIIVNALGNDFDADGGLLWILEAGTPGHGSVRISDDEQDIIYTPSADFNGTDSFSYTVVDSDGLESSGTVTVTVVAVNDEPFIASNPETILSAGAAYATEFQVSDVDNDDVSVTLLSGPAWLNLSGGTDGTYQFSGEPTVSDLGSHFILLLLSDGLVTVSYELTLQVADIAVQLEEISDLYFPGSNELDVPINTRFSWLRVDGATQYQLQVSTGADRTFSNALFDRTFLYGSSASNAIVNFMVFNLPDDETLVWRVRAHDDNNIGPWSSIATFSTGSGISTPVEDAFDVPETTELFQNYPNPFNPTTTISFNLQATENVTLTIYDLMGREVDKLVSGTLPAGRHEVQWDAYNKASGLYLYRMQVGSFVESKTLTLVR